MRDDLKRNTLYYGDCLEWMRQWPDESIDLIYLDPPFNSKSNYNLLYSDKQEDGQFMAFTDTWIWDRAAEDRFSNLENATARPFCKIIRGLHKFLGKSGMMAYLTYMAERLEEMCRILKSRGGGIYLHCNPDASHYLKLIMDAVFGHGNFRNEIVWHYNKWTNAAKYYQRNHDIILFYAKNEDYLFNKQFAMTDHKRKVIERGWDRNVVNGTKQLLVYDYFKSKTEIEKGNYDKVVNRSDKPNGTALHDVWHDINYLSSGAKERLGYPTQKPVALLERIISASSNEGDLVMDPFCGCGTTIEAARKLKRDFIGIDISPFACNMIKKRRLSNIPVDIQGIPNGMDSARQLARDFPFKFESWAVNIIPGMHPNIRQVGDRGIDGEGRMVDKPVQRDEKSCSNRVLAQVKSGKFHMEQLRAFIHVMDDNNAAIGIYITLDRITSPGARKKVVNTGKVTVNGKEYDRLQLWSISDYYERKLAGSGNLPDLPLMYDPYTGGEMKIDLLSVFE